MYAYIYTYICSKLIEWEDVQCTHLYFIFLLVHSSSYVCRGGFEDGGGEHARVTQEAVGTCAVFRTFLKE